MTQIEKMLTINIQNMHKETLRTDACRKGVACLSMILWMRGASSILALRVVPYLKEIGLRHSGVRL